MAMLGAAPVAPAVAPAVAPRAPLTVAKSNQPREAGWLASFCSKEVLLGTAAACVLRRAVHCRSRSGGVVRRAVEGTAPPLRRRRRKVPLERTPETSESAPSDMYPTSRLHVLSAAGSKPEVPRKLGACSTHRRKFRLTLNSCNCDLILDTVVEFEDLLRPNEAMALLEAARVTAEREGWGAATHKKYGTKDVKIRDLSSTAAQKIFQDKLAEPLIDAIGEYFELPKGDVSVDDAFIVRYATDSQRGLAFHRDGSIVSAIISLSDERDYVGGGTQFMDGSVYRPSQGGGILFGGQRLHGGVDITRGARYICTIFFKCGGLSCRDLAVLKDKEEEGDPGIWGTIADVLGVGK